MSDRVAVLNHTGVCVSDADRSVRFYTEVFGFQYWREFEAPDELAAPLLGLAPPLDHYNVYLRLGSFVLELLVFRGATPPHAPAVRREMNELGLTHLSISVPDIPATCAKVVEHGGTVEAATDIGLAVMVRDPDGQLIELLTMEYAQRVAAIE
jgi:catechol 2,3-dioxygenase-like lactoylglutathione lyase family enzyme